MFFRQSVNLKKYEVWIKKKFWWNEMNLFEMNKNL